MKLLCSACDSEIKFFQKNNSFLKVILGIGYLEAALNLQKILETQQEFSEIVFVGTAGSYSENLSIGEIVSVQQSALLLGLNDLYNPCDYPIFNSKADASFKTARSLSSLEITNNESLSSQIYKRHQQEYLVENMELYGIAKLADSYGIPWSAYLGITNYTNAKAHEDWLQNHLQVSRAMGLRLNWE